MRSWTTNRIFSSKKNLLPFKSANSSAPVIIFPEAAAHTFSAK